jgi:hypothetical protein
MPSFAPLILSVLISFFPGPSGPDAPVDAARRQVVVEALAKVLRSHYVFPEVGERSAAAVVEQLGAGRYGQARAQAFAEALTRSLRTITKDGHLRVRFDPSFRGSADPNAEPSAEEKASFREMAARHNFGVSRVEVLPGNVGLFDLRAFVPRELSAATLSAAMTVLSNTDALIMDLRQNGGGHPETVAFLCSYFFPRGQKVHLNDIYDRPKNETRAFWTDPSVPGPSYADKPVYVLTSVRTFSGAEEFSYNLQTNKRATLIGETTGGGAHPGGPVALGEGFVAFVPTGRAINPITKTNWEGTGVKPDIATPASEALKVAHLRALQAILATEKDERRHKALEETVQMVKKGEPKRPDYSRRD